MGKKRSEKEAGKPSTTEERQKQGATSATERHEEDMTQGEKEDLMEIEAGKEEAMEEAEEEMNEKELKEAEEEWKKMEQEEANATTANQQSTVDTRSDVITSADTEALMQVCNQWVDPLKSKLDKPPCNAITPESTPVKGKGNSNGKGARYFAVLLRPERFPTAEEIAEKLEKGQKSLAVDLYVLTANMGQPGNACAPWIINNPNDMANQKKMAAAKEANEKQGMPIVHAEAGANGQPNTWSFTQFEAAGFNRGKPIAGAKRLELLPCTPLTVWTDFQKDYKLRPSDQKIPLCDDTREGVDEWWEPLRIVEIELLNKGVQQGKEFNRCPFVLKKVMQSSCTPMQFYPAIRNFMPASKSDAVEATKALIMDDECLYGNQLCGKKTVAEGVYEVNQCMFLLPVSGPLKISQPGSKTVVAEVIKEDDGQPIRVIVPLDVFLKDANAHTVEQAIDMLSVLASTKGSVYLLVYHNSFLPLSAPGSFAHDAGSSKDNRLENMGRFVVYFPRWLETLSKSCVQQVTAQQRLCAKSDACKRKKPRVIKGLDLDGDIEMENVAFGPLFASVTLKPRPIKPLDGLAPHPPPMPAFPLSVVTDHTYISSAFVISVTCKKDGPHICDLALSSNRITLPSSSSDSYAAMQGQIQPFANSRKRALENGSESDRDDES